MFPVSRGTRMEEREKGNGGSHTKELSNTEPLSEN
jgi:hypothetical protein